MNTRMIINGPKNFSGIGYIYIPTSDQQLFLALENQMITEKAPSVTLLHYNLVRF